MLLRSHQIKPGGRYKCDYNSRWYLKLHLLKYSPQRAPSLHALALYETHDGITTDNRHHRKVALFSSCILSFCYMSQYMHLNCAIFLWNYMLYETKTIKSEGYGFCPYDAKVWSTYYFIFVEQHPIASHWIPFKAMVILTHFSWCINKWSHHRFSLIGLSPIRPRSFTSANTDLSSLSSQEHPSLKYEVKYKSLISSKCIWQCRLKKFDLIGH